MESNQNNKLFKPIFIIGAPRSGTSILGRILENHPDLVHVREPRLIWKYGNDKISDIHEPIHATDKVKKYIRKRFREYIEKENQRLLEKTPSNSLRVAFIYEIFPEGKFIHIIRNGYDSVLSIRGFWENRTSDVSYTRVESGENILQQRLKEIHWTQIPYYAKELLARIGNKIGIKSTVYWGPRLPEMDKLYKELDLLELCALQWKSCVELACKDGRKLPEDKYMEVRLEKLDWALVKKITNFLELEDTITIETYFKDKFQPEIANTRRKPNNEKEIEQIRKHIEPTMKWLGYKTDI